jgi:hypothetical protein
MSRAALHKRSAALRMQQATTEADITIAVLSEAYLKAQLPSQNGLLLLHKIRRAKNAS